MNKDVEQTRWSPGLVAFYAGCAAVSLGAAVTFTGIFVFDDDPAFVGIVATGVVLVVGGSVTMWRGLRSARLEG